MHDAVAGHMCACICMHTCMHAIISALLFPLRVPYAYRPVRSLQICMQDRPANRPGGRSGPESVSGRALTVYSSCMLSMRELHAEIAWH